MRPPSPFMKIRMLPDLHADHAEESFNPLPRWYAIDLGLG